MIALVSRDGLNGSALTVTLSAGKVDVREDTYFSVPFPTILPNRALWKGFPSESELESVNSAINAEGDPPVPITSIYNARSSLLYEAEGIASISVAGRRS